MLFKAAAALVLTLLSITTSASPTQATTLERRARQGPGPTGITVQPRDRQNYTAGHGVLLKYQGFLRVTLETAAVDVILQTANGLNGIVLAQDMGAFSKANLYEASFLLPTYYHMNANETGKPLEANIVIYEREKQFLGNGTFKFQTRYKAQAPRIVINGAQAIVKGKASS